MNAIRTSIAAALMALGAASMLPSGSVLAAAPPAAAAEPAGQHRGPGGGPERMFEKLGLSAEQKSKVDAIVAAKASALKSLHEQMRTNMEKLRSIKPDDATYSAVLSQIAKANGSLTTQAISEQGDMQAKLYAVLTPEQRTQLSEKQARMRERMKEGGKRWGHRPPEGDDVPGAEPSEDGPPL